MAPLHRGRFLNEVQIVPIKKRPQGASMLRQSLFLFLLFLSFFFFFFFWGGGGGGI
jgi:hypothetical protein